MKWLKILSLGLLIWGMSLVWLEVNQVLLSPLMLALALVVAVAGPAYLLGHYFGQLRNQKSTGADFEAHTTRPTAVMVKAWQDCSIHSRRTLPLREAQFRAGHSRPTRPMPWPLPR